MTPVERSEVEGLLQRLEEAVQEFERAYEEFERVKAERPPEDAAAQVEEHRQRVDAARR
jgi:hypothetical protein